MTVCVRVIDSGWMKIGTSLFFGEDSWSEKKLTEKKPRIDLGQFRPINLDE